MEIKTLSEDYGRGGFAYLGVLKTHHIDRTNIAHLDPNWNDDSYKSKIDAIFDEICLMLEAHPDIDSISIQFNTICNWYE